MYVCSYFILCTFERVVCTNSMLFCVSWNSLHVCTQSGKTMEWFCTCNNNYRVAREPFDLSLYKAASSPKSCTLSQFRNHCKMMLFILLNALGSVTGAPPAPPQAVPVTFNSTQSSFMVLQQAPAKSAVYGVVGTPSTTALSPTITVTVQDTASGGASYIVQASITNNGTEWKALLNPSSGPGGDFTITATCTGCANSTAAVLEHVTFGDVWYCAGQSNMWLPMGYTFSRNTTVDAINSGKYSNIRLMAGNSQSATTFP